MKKFAVIETGGKQYKIYENSIINIEKLTQEVNTEIKFDKVLLKHDKTTTIGSPYIENATVTASIIEQFKDSKKIVFKFKNKTGYQKKQGHRQNITKVKITKI
ncbi:50S ribosomal protein L21 [Candidatus Marinamargulisbacteria bacterium SCGC AG-410-N11]|nr:50S ribosomal protein L21 [Candidatus Marinamargulisbacteria bacterium SCGC AG-410-N11]